MNIILLCLTFAVIILGQANLNIRFSSYFLQKRMQAGGNYSLFIVDLPKAVRESYVIAIITRARKRTLYQIDQQTPTL